MEKLIEMYKYYKSQPRLIQLVCLDLINDLLQSIYVIDNIKKE